MIITIQIIVVHLKVRYLISSLYWKKYSNKKLILIKKLLIEWQYLNIYFLVGYFLSLLGYIVVCLIPSTSYDLINTFIMQSLILGDDLYWSYFMIFSSPSLLFFMLLTAVTAIIPDLVLKTKENLDVSKLIKRLKQNINDNVTSLKV